MQEFPEVDRAAWFPLAEAAEKIHPGQAGFLHELARLLVEDSGGGG
jgi:predicted NUDIX family NTP pyrophosphohydrolase